MSTTTTAEPPCLDGRTGERIVDVLGEPRSRRILDHLAERTRPVDLDALARALVAGTGRSGPGSESKSEGAVERIAVELHHLHLPKMQALGLLDYDAGRKVVRERDDGTADSGDDGA